MTKFRTIGLFILTLDIFAKLDFLKNSVFDLTKIPFLICLIVISCLMVEVLNDRNPFKKIEFG